MFDESTSRSATAVCAVVNLRTTVGCPAADGNHGRRASCSRPGHPGLGGVPADAHGYIGGSAATQHHCPSQGGEAFGQRRAQLQVSEVCGFTAQQQQTAPSLFCLRVQHTSSAVHQYFFLIGPCRDWCDYIGVSGLFPKLSCFFTYRNLIPGTYIYIYFV